jgi:hypothetical protein
MVTRMVLSNIHTRQECRPLYHIQQVQYLVQPTMKQFDVVMIYRPLSHTTSAIFSATNYETI